MASPTQSSGGLSPQSSPTFSAAPTAHSSAPSSRRCEKSPACYGGNRFDPHDESKDLTKPCHGWPQLVKEMVDKPGFESFQSFRDLNIKSLLYYQAELAQLRTELHALEWKDHRKSGESAELFCESIRTLLLAKDSAECQRQLSKVNQIREVLKEYNAALLQYAEINKLPKADAFNVKAFRNWIFSNIDTTLTISGPGADSWGKLVRQQPEKFGLWKLLKSIFKEENSQEDQVDYPDLVVPGKEEDTDSLTRWVASHGTPYWHSLKKTFKRKVVNFRQRAEGLPRDALAEKRTEAESKEEDRCASLSTYSRHRMVRFTNFVATIVACLLPIVGIVVLSELHTKAKTLGFIALFTAIFAIGIMVLTDSRTSRTEVFTATAAFAAVLVVFVQNQSPASVAG